MRPLSTQLKEDCGVAWNGAKTAEELWMNDFAEMMQESFCRYIFCRKNQLRLADRVDGGVGVNQVCGFCDRADGGNAIYRSGRNSWRAMLGRENQEV